MSDNNAAQTHGGKVRQHCLVRRGMQPCRFDRKVNHSVSVSARVRCLRRPVVCSALDRPHRTLVSAEKKAPVACQVDFLSWRPYCPIQSQPDYLGGERYIHTILTSVKNVPVDFWQERGLLTQKLTLSQTLIDAYTTTSYP